jgi:hypothetical protein
MNPPGIRFAASDLMFLYLFSVKYITGDENAVQMPLRPIKEVFKEHTDELMSLPVVVGLYIGALGDGTPCIKVMVVKKTPELERKIPSMLDGYPVLIVESGEIHPLSSPMD